LNNGQQSRPLFAEGFPRDPKLDALVEAFSRGDFAHVRREGPLLARDAPDEGVRKAAQVLVERTAPARGIVGLLALAGLLLLVLAGWWIAHGKAPPGPAPGAPHVEHVRE
jgi:hypothetical protein